jgi:hypothetical protein
VEEDGLEPIARAETVLDADGEGSALLEPPPDLRSGRYRVVATLSDGSGRRVRRSLPHLLRRPADEGQSGALAALPSFHAAGEALVIPTRAAALAVASCSAGAEPERRTIPASGGAVRLVIDEPGWYELEADGESRRLFVFGGSEPPLEEAKRMERGPAGEAESSGERWVDLGDFALEEDGAPSPWTPPELLALFDRRRLALGEPLRLLVYTPAAGARIIFTIEGETVADYFIAEPSGERYRAVEIPTSERHLPAFYLQGRVLAPAADAARTWQRARLREARKARELDDGEDPGWCRVDVMDTRPARGGERLRVEVAPARSEYRPGEEVAVRIEVKDLEGRPKAAEVALAAVDEAIFGFAEDRAGLLSAAFSDPHPPRRFLRKEWRSSFGRCERTLARAMAVERLQNAVQRQALEAARRAAAPSAPERPAAPPLGAFLEAAMPPATELPLSRLRLDFRETAAWQPQLRAGDDGVIETSFRLPDSLASYRLTAIGLTRATEIGTGRASLRARLPLAVEVLLPRFAVEGDRVEAVGLIHNSTAERRLVAVRWEVAGARLEAPEAAAALEGRHELEPGATRRVALPIVLEEAGRVRIALRAADGRDADAEERVLDVRPLGRPQEVHLNGAFSGRQELRLPAGFTPDRVRLTISRGELAQALEGLEYLVEFPYGCVEQTLSRFLPALAVRRALGEVPLTLPEAVERKLPEVLARGLERLYAFQRADGGWGWWEHDGADAGEGPPPSPEFRRSSKTKKALALRAICSRAGVLGGIAFAGYRVVGGGQFRRRAAPVAARGLSSRE